MSSSPLWEWPIHLAWVLSFFPGFLLLTKAFPRDLRGGLFPVLGLSYFWTFVLLTPASVVGYLSGAPLRMLTIWWLLLTVPTSAWCLSRLLMGIGKGRFDLYVRGRTSHYLPLGLLVAVIALAIVLITGPTFQSDATFHIARARSLLSHGFNNADPFYEGRPFGRVYHTNILAAYLATLSDVTGANMLSVWWVSSAWSKVLISSGMSYVAWVVFGNRRAAALTWVATIIYSAPLDFTLYPNQMASVWVMPLALGFVLQLDLGVERLFSSVAKFFSASWVIAQVHPLYAAIILVYLGVVLLWVFAKRVLKRRSPKIVIACALALTLAPAPFLLAYKYYQLPVTARDLPTLYKDVAKEVTKVEKFTRIRSPKEVLAASDNAIIAFWPAIVIGLILGLRRRIWGLPAISGVVALIVYIPPITYTYVSLTGGHHFTLERLKMIWRISSLVLVPGASLLLSGRFKRSALAAVLATILAASFAMHYKRPSMHWGTLMQNAAVPKGMRRQRLRRLVRLQSYLERHIPAGSTVVASGQLGPYLGMLRDIRLLASRHRSPRTRGESARVSAQQALRSTRTPTSVRDQLLDRYDIEIVAGHVGDVVRLERIYQDRIVEINEYDGIYIIKLGEAPTASSEPG